MEVVELQPVESESLRRGALLRALACKVSPVIAQQDRLARAVHERRRMLGLTLDQLQEAGGPSDVTTGKIERGAHGNPSARTLRRLDVGLRWVEGSAARVLAGSDPTPLEGVPAPRDGMHRAFAADEDSVTLSLSVVNELSDIAKRYEELAESAPPEWSGEVRSVNVDLDLLVDRILRAWLIAQLETTAGPDSPLRGNPVVEMLLGDYLNRTPMPPSSEDARELKYLRWLTGRATDIDAATEKTFIDQWRARQERKAP